jgi:hypothetical protein
VSALDEYNALPAWLSCDEAAAVKRMADAMRDELVDKLAIAERFINRFIVHDGEARPYSVREGQLMLEKAEAQIQEGEQLVSELLLREPGPQDEVLWRRFKAWLMTRPAIYPSDANPRVALATVHHVCGLQGFNPTLGDECAACRARGVYAQRPAETEEAPDA